MNKAKNLLDSLMGTHRDVQAKDKTGDEFREKDVCKHFLVGFCPDKLYGKILQKEKNPLDHRPLMPDVCTLNHSVAMKADFEKHPKADSFRRDYEEKLLRRLEEIVSDVDRMIAIGRPKCKVKESYMRPIGDPRVSAQREILVEEKGKLTSEVVQKGEAGDVSGSQIAAEKIKECIRQIELIELRHTVNFPGEECCAVCSVKYLKGEKSANVNSDIATYTWEPEHMSGSKAHLAYIDIRDRLENMKTKKKERQLESKVPASDQGHKDGEKDVAADDCKHSKDGARGGSRDRKTKGRDDKERSRDRRDRQSKGTERSRSRGRQDRERRDSDRRGQDRRDDERRRDRSTDRGKDRDRGGRRDSDSNRRSDGDRRSDHDDRYDRRR